MFYECSDVPLRSAVSEFRKNVDIVIGSEGGFEPAEVVGLVIITKVSADACKFFEIGI